MDKTKIKNFAIDARRQLIEEITLKARLIGIKKDGIQEPTNETNEIQFFGEYSISGEDIQRRQKLVTELKKRSTGKKLEEVLPVFIEEIAYTWFNRLIAIRFMEVNRYLPSRIRVLSSETPGQNQPDIITEAFNSDLKFNATETEQIKFALLNQTVDVMNDLYKMIFIKQANKLNDVLPQLFEKITDYSELLFTPNYTDVNGVIHKLVNDIDEADFDVTKSGQVEIIGWLYQYYNTEPHEHVVNITGGAVKRADIPAATQLFTTDWVVRYMVDNSLGKYWIEHEANSKIDKDLKYLLPGDIKRRTDGLKLENIKILDNAMGSGHILVYAFDVLIKMYEERGYSSREAASLILANNIVGLEIDKRAYQLAYFALMMKAREYNRRILTSNISPRVYVFRDVTNIPDDVYKQLSETTATEIKALVTLFSDATELGSIMQFEKQYDIELLKSEITKIKADELDVFGIAASKDSIINMLNIINVLQIKYEVVVTNPPYMNKFETSLKKYINNHFKAYKGDLFSVFIFNNLQMLKPDGYAAYMTPFVWMFIKTYEALRTYIVDNKQISSLIQMEYSAFEEATVPINTFVIQNSPNHELGSYVKLSEFTGGMAVQDQKVLEIIENPDAGYLYRTNQANFKKIPGSPIAYWASMSILSDFDRGTILGDIAKSIHGSVTGNNNYFLKQWYEVTYINIYFTAEKSNDQIFKNINWVPYNKGGNFRKWYGNYDFVLKWKNFGEEVTLKGDMRNPSYYFKPSLTWSLITSGNFAARFRTKGSIHDAAGASAYFESENSLLYVMGLLNTPVGNHIFKILNPTINLSNGVVLNFPTLCADSDVSEYVIILVKSQITIAKKDWDSFETSWDFTQHPLLSQIDEHNRNWTVEAAYESWADEAQTRFDQLKANEEELNRIFIDLYGLQDELTPEVEDKDVSVRRADQNRDIKSLLSYFIGLVFGRYSLDVDGLAFAGGEFDKSKYTTFIPNTDDVVMLTDADYFGDERDIIYRFKEFLAVTFGEDNLLQNLSFIADVLGGKGKPEEVIRNYFFKDFFKDHVQIYKKRPIYWQLESGKLGGFKALIYLHRYDENTMAMIRTNYLNELQNAYEARLSTLTNLIDNATDTKSKSGYEKQRVKLTNQLDELVIFEDKVAYLANRHVALDLDDGVVENYKKVQSDEDGNLLNVFSKLK
ncbi:BREX-1 system adenine-specific DNA-methyltransferase PglX [Leuconostoc citreum]|uniref:BREX-1 system adenine-specific DNA-methyltransferase PglX n=1 Tax=Leuconostoc citreum TaxID=33964 RepID=UPI002A838065|nr:BREX-1 system adenine-specific DNA-methyltransferase PglX [Leuconostoc citreum]MDY5161211.1 BREX-1 system adenine-specific DNA-methyltransferase PglX [Leuconostoc citreum]MDY5164781.1 BREX-1 system adenine-specific DNA-methyltransferase PglX [Leuconostoc citreum]